MGVASTLDHSPLGGYYIDKEVSLMDMYAKLKEQIERLDKVEARLDEIDEKLREFFGRQEPGEYNLLDTISGVPEVGPLPEDPRYRPEKSVIDELKEVS